MILLIQEACRTSRIARPSAVEASNPIHVPPVSFHLSLFHSLLSSLPSTHEMTVNTMNSLIYSYSSNPSLTRQLTMLGCGCRRRDIRDPASRHPRIRHPVFRRHLPCSTCGRPLDCCRAGTVRGHRGGEQLILGLLSRLL